MSYQYYRPRWSKTVKNLIIINGILFLAALIGGYRFYLFFGLVPKFVWKKLMLWQPITYMFLHGGFFHIFFNMFALWMFGTEIEYLWGKKEFLRYYFITGVGAGILTVLTSPNSTIPTVGASGAIYGILLAYGLLFPDRLIYLFFLIPIKAKHLVILFGIVEFFAALSHTSGGIAHFAHLGGLLVGLVYLKVDFRHYFLKLKEKIIERKVSQQRWKISKLKEEVDRILEKISDEGVDSLTEEEKKTLDQASDIFEDIPWFH